MREPERVLTRTQIAEHVWNYDVFNHSNVVDVYIRNLRRKLDDGAALKLLHTVRGAGYGSRRSRTMPRPRTLRARLSLGIAVLVLAVLAAVGLVVYYGTARVSTASLDASLRTATAQAMAGDDNQNGRLTLGPQLDEGVGSDDLHAPGLSLAVFSPSDAVLLGKFWPVRIESSPQAAGARRGAARRDDDREPRSTPAAARVRCARRLSGENGRTLAVFSVALSEEPTLATLRSFA